MKGLEWGPSNLGCTQDLAWVCQRGLTVNMHSKGRTGLLSAASVSVCGSQRVRHNWSDFSSVQFSRSVMSNSLRPHESQHARPPCPSPTPGVYSNSCSLSWWCHPSHLILCRPLLPLPPIPPSIKVFSNESALKAPMNLCFLSIAPEGHWDCLPAFPWLRWDWGQCHQQCTLWVHTTGDT